MTEEECEYCNGPVGEGVKRGPYNFCSESCKNKHWKENWECPDCGSSDPHHAMTFPLEEEFEDEIEVDVTCETVYFTFVDGSQDPGMAFTHDEFEEIIEHFKSRPDFT